MSKLTNRRNVNVPFELCFKYKLQKGYSFDELSMQNIKEFQRFLNKVSKMNITDVDKLYLRRSDKNDLFMNNQIQHYEITSSFRIHVVLEEGYYKIIRLDPNHKVHK